MAFSWAYYTTNMRQEPVAQLVGAVVTSYTHMVADTNQFTFWEKKI